MDCEVIPPNEQLLAAREKQSWSRAEVAVALNLPQSAIVSLESGEYEKLHGEAFVTGYIRAYATLFDFSSAQIEVLIQAYLDDSRLPQVFSYKEPEMYNAKQTAIFQHKQFKTGYGLAAALMVFSTLAVFSVQQPAPLTFDAAADIRVETAVGTTVINPLDELPDENPTQDILPVVKLQQNISQQHADNILRQRLQGDVMAATEAVIMDSQLSFQFSADCWVEILDGDGKIIYASLQKAQEQLELSGKPPFRITLGYAPGVELSYNGQPVKLDAKNADLVKLVLGNS